MALQKGSSGDAVKQLQTALKKYDSYMFGDIVADGIFGTGTENAVKTFQQMKGLTVDGIAGTQTLNALGLLPTMSSTTPSYQAPSSPVPASSSGMSFMSMFESIPKPVLYGSLGVIAVGLAIIATRKKA